MKTNVALVVAILCLPFHAGAQPPTAADMDRIFEEVSNWGRWGESDQLGTLNLITEETRRNAAGLVQDGISVSMAQTLLSNDAVDNGNPFEHAMLAPPSADQPWIMDKFGVVFHGYVHSHIDSLCHHQYKGQFYNGGSLDEVKESGCGTGSVMSIADGIFTRGVLIDIPRIKGREWLEPGEPVTLADIRQWEAETGIQVQSGDAVLLRTGRWARREALGPFTDSFSGWHASTVEWLSENDVAIIGSDAALDVMPSGVEGMDAPVHLLVLNALGMPVLDALNLEAVAEKAAELGRWDFLLTASPLKVEGATGSPLNPIATF